MPIIARRIETNERRSGRSPRKRRLSGTTQNVAEYCR
jgi:hypothetical protein